jgi:predicted methyltransferase
MIRREVLTTMAAGLLQAPRRTGGWASVLDRPERASDRGDDDRRRLLRILQLAQVRAGQTVADLIPGKGYFTRAFSLAVGPSGAVFAVIPDQYAKVSAPEPDMMRQMAARPAWANVQVLEQPADAFGLPRPADLVFTALNFHDYANSYMAPASPSGLAKNVFHALKPGGRFMIVDHVAAAGSGLAATETLHRVDPTTVQRIVRQAGFVLEAEDAALRHAGDDHTKPVYDPAVKGRTDQFIYVFRRPRPASRPRAATPS